MKRIFVEHRVPNVDPDQVMAKNLDTGEFCRADLLFTGPVVQDPDLSSTIPTTTTTTTTN